MNKYAPLSQKRVREHDIPHITRLWKNPLSMKRNTGKFSKDRTVENLELKRKYRNLPTHIGTKRRKNTKTDKVSPTTLSNLLLATKARDLRQ